MKYCVLLLLPLFFLASCSKKEGCTNEWGNNYAHEAILDCCCEFDVQTIITELTGNYQLTENCSGEKTQYDITISKDANHQEGILISNFNNSGFEAAASWKEGEFKLDNDWNQNVCTVALTGSVHKASSKLYFIYASFPENTCDDTQGKTCEARQM